MVERFLARLAGIVVSGRVVLEIEGRPFAQLDGAARDATVDISPMIPASAHQIKLPLRHALAEAHESLRFLHRFADRLAALQWRLNVVDAGRPIVSLGRGASALTGHVQAHLGAVRELPKLFF